MICRMTEQKFYIEKKKICKSIIIVPSGVTKFTGTNCIYIYYIYMNNLIKFNQV